MAYKATELDGISVKMLKAGRSAPCDKLLPYLQICLSTFIQHIKVEKYNQFGFFTSYGPRSSLVPIHGLQSADDESNQFQPNLIINGSLILTVKTGASFQYLGRHFDFNMSNNTHKSELSQLTNSILTDMYLLPLHPKN